MPKLTPAVRTSLLVGGFLMWLLASGYGIFVANLFIAFVVGPAIFIACLFLSLEKRSCPNCNHVVRSVATSMKHCMKCGAALDDADQTEA